MTYLGQKMTETEFVSWCRDFACRFPDTGNWLLNEDRRDTLRVWFADVFQRLEYGYASSATVELEREGFPAYDRERIPSIVQRKVSEMRSRISRCVGSGIDLRSEQLRAKGEATGLSMRAVLTQALVVPSALRSRYIADMFSIERVYPAQQWIDDQNNFEQI